MLGECFNSLPTDGTKGYAEEMEYDTEASDGYVTESNEEAEDEQYCVVVINILREHSNMFSSLIIIIAVAATIFKFAKYCQKQTIKRSRDIIYILHLKAIKFEKKEKKK